MPYLSTHWQWSDPNDAQRSTMSVPPKNIQNSICIYFDLVYMDGKTWLIVASRKLVRVLYSNTNNNTLYINDL